MGQLRRLRPAHRARWVPKPHRRANAQQPSGQERRADVEINSIGVDLRTDDEGTRRAAHCFIRRSVLSGGESRRGVAHPSLRGSVMLARSDRVQNRDRIGDDR